ncbi:Tyrosine--tRNA ligase [bacterium AB1]|nr:Tyrosine--tRNA ligase [bacterium AB1]
MFFNIKNILGTRKLIYQNNLENTNKCFKSAYFGIDPTSSYLHIGHLLYFIIAQIMSDNNMKVYILVGDFTYQIGDPSFRENVRNKESYNKNNVSQITKIVSRLANHMKLNYEIVYNSSWMKNLTIDDYLKEVGKNFNVKDILNSRVFSNRSEDIPLTLSELIYCTIQGYDFYFLFKEKNCDLQIGGQDQWFNMISGCSLIRKKENKESYIITVPLVTDKYNQKIGKTLNTNHFKIYDSIYPITYWCHINNLDSFVLNNLLVNTDIANIDDLKKYLFCCFFTEEAFNFVNFYYKKIINNEEINYIAKYNNFIYFENYADFKINMLFRLTLDKEVDSKQIENIIKNGVIINGVKFFNKKSIFSNIKINLSNYIVIKNYVFIFFLKEQ